MKTYEEILDYLFYSLPNYQKQGEKAFNAKLDGITNFCDAIGQPHKKFKSIHVAGTNGKGSTCHMLAGALATSGYKVGLYTSPHLKDFTERIRVNGEQVSKDYVLSFVNKNKELFEECGLSFFEMTVAMAFAYFAEQKVDFAIIEVGLGGRLDATNIIHPILSLITNIGLDHQHILGETLEEIAYEKGGIIKKNTPVIIGKKQSETLPVFTELAHEKNSSLYFSSDYYRGNFQSDGIISIQNLSKEESPESYLLDLQGYYQVENLVLVLLGLDMLRSAGYELPEECVKRALKTISKDTGLKGRWQILGNKPLVICDTGHNDDGLNQISTQLSDIKYEQLWILFGAVKGKNHETNLSILPSDAKYIFCEANIERAEPANNLLEISKKLSLDARVIKDLREAQKFVMSKAVPNDVVFIGGSTFLVAEINGL